MDNSTTITVRIPTSQREALLKLHSESGDSIQSLITMALDRFLDDLKRS